MSEQPKPLGAEQVENIRKCLTAGDDDAIHSGGAAMFRNLFATFDAERARADAAEKSCEDWQECAAHLALALKNAVHPSVYSAEVAMALAEFDRLAGEATKGVEL